MKLALEYNPQLRVAPAQRDGTAAGIVMARAVGPQFSWPNALTGPGARGLRQHYSIHQPIELPAVRALVKQVFFRVRRRRNAIVLAIENLKLIEDLRRGMQVQVEVVGAAPINRDTAKRRIVIGINVQHRDLGGWGRSGRSGRCSCRRGARLSGAGSFSTGSGR